MPIAGTDWLTPVHRTADLLRTIAQCLSRARRPLEHRPLEHSAIPSWRPWPLGAKKTLGGAGGDFERIRAKCQMRGFPPRT